MRRRALLSAVATGLAGCVSGRRRGSTTVPPTDTAVDRASPTDATASDRGTAGTASATRTPTLAERGSPAEICETNPFDVGIAAILDPAFAEDWSGIEVKEFYEGGLADDRVVVGLAGDGQARAYPISVLYHHEIVNDTFAPVGGPVLVTFCSLCRSGMVAERVVRGEPTNFHVSGQLWEPPEVQTRAAEADGEVFAVNESDADPGEVRNAGNLVMIDERTSSYWSQLLVRAICGPLRGETLSVVPAETATWGEWRGEHPDTEVLLPPPHSAVAEEPF